jgi:hypothetical protein
MSERSQITTFHLTSSQPRAWLVISRDDAKTQVIEMWKGYSNRWSASAWLMCGEYRCRYYCGDEKHVVYHGPAHINSGTDEGMDGLESIKILGGDNERKLNQYSAG